MVEVMDRATARKIMVMLLCGVCYQGDCYLIYCIRRDKDEANIFVSKLIKGSMGYVIDDNFLNGEKEVLDSIVQRLLNKESRESLEKAGFSIIRNLDMDDNLTFDMNKCYVSTTARKLIKDCLIYYGLVNERLFDRPVVEVVDDKRKFNEGFASSIVLIVFGIIIFAFSCFVIFNVAFG